jgi:hypothetical protein
MDLESGVINTVVVTAALGLIAYMLYRLLRWARGRTKGAHVLGAVLAEVTQGAVVYEAKQGKKRDEGNAGDPPNEE